VSDARGNTLTHEYESMDRLSRRIDQLGRSETFSYDGNGNLVSTTDRKGQTTTFTYDPVNRRVRSEFADGAVATFTYDAAGRLVLADDTADPHRPITLAYDSLDRLLAETTSLGTVGYRYDALGRRTQMTVSGQSPVTYSYDAASRLRTITQAPLNPVTIDYDALGRRTMLTLPNQVSTEYQYDAASRLTALIYRNALGQLGDLTYQYDAAGNRISVGGSFARTLVPAPVPSATYDPANRQLVFGNRTMTFDADGNLATLTEAAGISTLTWDARNRLVALSGPGVLATFGYEALARRVRRAIKGQAASLQHDGLDTIREQLDGSDVRYLRSLGVDEALGRMDATGVAYYLAEGLGSTTALVGENGTLSTFYRYDPFGRTVIEGSATSNPLAFTGRETDGTGLYFYRARYYHPILSRFLSEDPIGLAGGDVNLFVYVGNNPTTYFDPYGLWGWRFLPGGRTLFPSQRFIPRSARPVPRSTPDPRLQPPPWTPAPNPLQNIPRLHKPIQPGFPELPPCFDTPCIGPGMSAPPVILEDPPPGPALPGPREKPPPSRPEPEIPPEWEECYQQRLCA